MSIKEQVKELLTKGWYSTNMLVQTIGAQSADRRRRDLKGIITRKVRKHGKWITEYTIPNQLKLI